MPNPTDPAKNQISAGKPNWPDRWVAELPALAPVGAAFGLSLSATDIAGNPADLSGETVRLETERPVEGLPETVTFAPGEQSKVIDGLSLAEECELSIRVRGPGGSVLVESNPCRVTDSYPFAIRWSSRRGLPEGSDIASAYPGAASQFAILEAGGGPAGASGRAGHYATTGARVFVSASVRDGVFALDMASASPVERVELRDGGRILDIMRPFAKRDLGARVRILWEGMVPGSLATARWDGSLYLHGNRIRQAKAINLPAGGRALETRGDMGLAWRAEAEAGLGGVDLWLADASAGRFEIEIPGERFEILLEDIGLEDMCFDLDSAGKRLRVYRLPERLTAKTLKWSRSLAGVSAAGLTACVTFEDGHQAWTAPLAASGT